MFAVIAALFMTTELYAQEFTMTATAGVAIPIGDFGDTDIYNNEDAELAKTGLHLNLNLHYRFNHLVGLALNVAANAHKTDASAIEDFLEEDTGFDWNVSDPDAYGVSYVLVGPTIGTYGESMALTLQPGIGLSAVGEDFVSYSNFLIPASGEVNSRDGTGLAWGVALSGIVYLGESIGLTFDGRLLGNNIERDSEGRISVGAGAPIYTENTYDLKATAIAFGMGLMVKF